MSVRAEKIQQAEILSNRGGVRPILATVSTTVKRAVLTVWTVIDKVLLTPSPKAAARHGLEMWASAEHVSRSEISRYQSMDGRYRH